MKIDAQTGARTTLLDDGLLFPGGLAIAEGPNGPVLYVSTHTNEPTDGTALRIAPVPEPGAWALMLAGLGVVLATASRRRGRLD